MPDSTISDLVRPVTQYQIGDGVPWAAWEANMFGAASEFQSYDVVSSVERALSSYKSLYTRIEDREYTKDELVRHLYSVCDQRGIDRTIAYAQIMQESSFNPSATGAFCALGSFNKKCALGIAQFIPATATTYGLRVDREVDERLDPIKSLSAWGRYMSDLLMLFKSDYLKALAAYNAGPGTVQKSIERNGDGWLAGMPMETRVYVVKIVGERAITDATVLESVQQSLDKGASTKIGLWDLLTSDLGPDLIKRYALLVVGLIILFGLALAAGLKVYRKFA